MLDSDSQEFSASFQWHLQEHQLSIFQE